MSQGSGLRPRGPKEERFKVVPRVLLDITDLRAIENELSVVGPVEVTSDEFQGTAASIDEFVQTGAKSLESVAFSADIPRERPASRPVDFPDLPGSPGLKVSVSKDRVYVHTFASENRLVSGVAVKVEQICRARSRRLAEKLPNLAFGFAGLGFVLWAISGAFEGQDKRVTTTAAALILSGVALLLCAAIAALVAKFSKGGILLVRREERPGWFQRNKDGLAVQVIGGLVVLGAGILIGRLISQQ